jgi:O-antigen chain-terminating methyltransferase
MAGEMMLDVQNPEIKVDEIMQRIQAKVRLRREQAVPRPVAGSAGVPTDSLAFNQLFAHARDAAQVGLTVPPMSRTHGLKRALAEPIAKAFLRLAQLITRDQRAFNQIVLTALQALNEQQARSAAELAARSDSTAAVLNQSAVALNQAAAALSQRVDQLDARMRAAEEEVTRVRQDQSLKLDQLRTAVSLQERRLTSLLEEARSRLEGPLDASQLRTFADELPHVADAGYLTFEDAFRGSREKVKELVAVYLPKLRAAEAGAEGHPILDLGCGRGELLEVLREQGLKASGVDCNRAAVDKCREAGLDVALGDAFDHLRSVPDGTLGAVTALHLIEHLPFPLVLRLLDETLRVLRPGGIAIFETPNPNNILVGATNFYLDPTHRNPVHPQTLRYLAETRGLVQVETLMLHPYPKEMRIPEETAVARTFNEYFYGPQDYAVLGRRP